MEEKIKELCLLLKGKRIRYRTISGFKNYTIKGIYNRKNNIVIETVQNKTFVQNLKNIDDFIESIEILSEFEEMQFLLTEKEEVKNEIQAPEIADNVSDGLMSIFNDLTAKKEFSDTDIKQAKLAVDVAGKIIDIEKVKLGYLALNFR